MKQRKVHWITLFIILNMIMGLYRAEPLQLDSATTSPLGITQALVGSLKGMTTIYIRGAGFNPIAAQNTVLVGDYPCVTSSKGVNTNFLTCDTTDPSLTTDSGPLSISVTANGEKKTLVGSAYTFQYKDDSTPKLSGVYPSTSVGNSKVKFYGVHRITALGSGLIFGDIRQLTIGDVICGRLDIIDEPDIINSATLEFISCIQARDQEAGKYNVREEVTPGLAANNIKMKRTSFTSENYEFAVLPAVQSITPATGGVGGANINIKGTGFSSDSSKVKVSVDKVQCKVTSSTLTEVNCELKPKTASDSAKLPTANPSTQVNGYISGSGFSYQRYSISSLSTKTSAGLKAAVDSSSGSITLLESGVRAQLQTPDIYGTYYGEVFKGYFKAPYTGLYNFSALVDDDFLMYFNTVAGSAQVPATPIIQTGWNYDPSLGRDYQNPYYNYASTSFSQPLSLTQNQYYYVEVYHTNLGGSGGMKVAVQTPNPNTATYWQTHQIVELSTQFTNSPQIMKFTVQGVTSGTFNLKLVRYSGTKLTYNKNVTLNWNSTASQFISGLTQFDNYNGYGLTGTMTSSTINGVYTVAYTITIDKLRTNTIWPNDKFNFTSTVAGSSFVEQRIQEHSPLISGSINIGEFKVYSSTTNAFTQVNIPYNIQADALKKALQNIGPGYSSVQVLRSGTPEYGAKWLVSYIGINNNVYNPSTTLSDFNLVGGAIGTKPTAAISIKRQYSSSLIFDPIDQNFMYMASATPNVLVQVNGLTSACIGSCSYSFITVVPEISSATISGSQLSIGLTIPGSLTVSLSDISVTFDSNVCSNPTGTSTSFTCQLLTNTDNTPLVRAGNHMPKVTIANIGIIQPASGVNPIAIALNLNSANPSSFSTNGGKLVTLSGHGFPFVSSQAVITLCEKTVQIISISNIATQIRVPACQTQGAQVLTYTYNSISKTLSLTYVTAAPIEISSISPTSSSPVLKGVMQIVGTGFGTDPSVVTVHLSNSTGKVYQFRVITMNDTHIQAGIPGGLKGTFKVIVTVDQEEAIPSTATANQFKYQLSITNIQPNTGNHYGGTRITITGKNFSPDKNDNIAYVGTEINWFCDIQSVTSTTIICRTPPRSKYYASATNAVSIQSKLIAETNCDGTCDFTYNSQATSPVITQISVSTANEGNQITLTGSNFDPTGVFVALKHSVTQKVTIVTPTAITSTSVKFLVPAAEAGIYAARVRKDPLGQSNGIALTIGMVVSAALSPASLSVNGGSISLTGSGLPDGWPNSQYELSVTVSSAMKTPDVIQSTPSKLTLRIPQGANNLAYSITIKNGATSVTKTFSQLNSATPAISFTGTTTIPAMTSTVVTINRTTLATSSPSKLYVYSILDPTTLTEIVSFDAANGTTITFSLSLKSGKYGIKAFYNSYGWAITSNSLTVSSVGSYAVVSTAMSYNGGTVKVTGSNINPSATVTIGGLVAQYQSSTATQALFSVPGFVTTSSIVTFPEISPVSKITGVTITGDIATNIAFINDGFFSTSYSSTASTCWIQMDFGVGKTVKLNRIRYFPYNKWTIASTYLFGAKFQWSADATTWTTISTIDGSVHAGWNTIVPSTQINSRYIRFSHTTVSACKIAQFQAYGSLIHAATAANTPNFSADAVFFDGLTTITSSGGVQFREDATPIVTSITPKNGDVLGNYPITIAGTFPSGSAATVVIDGINCAVTGFTTSSITCTVGARPTLPSSNSFVVMIDNKKAINRATFSYVMRWSDIKTWGTDLPPIDDDLVVVPKGMTLFVDQSTPNLKGIIVDGGNIVFADQADMVIETGFITINKGSFTAGTQANPYQHKLTFLMHGSYYGRHQPTFGNKGIGCMECQFSMYGKKRTRTWTMIQNTINVGATTLTLQQDVDWQVGERIVVASTSFDHTEAEEAVIKSITSNRIIEVESPFKFKHYAGQETYGTHKLIMRAEVGLLSRNILMRGDDESVTNNYGSHLLMAGKSENGLKAVIAYSEFTKCGQPAIVGRYCIHFHMNGDVMDSLVQGNAVHHSMARVITIHGVHYLRVLKNVGYEVKGHNFFVEDGIETNNVIEYNLAIKSLQVWNMMQTDISVASFWITNPYNHVRFNHAAGGDFYGFWYQIKANPDGPSTTSDICPIGNPLGQSHDNVAHSYLRFGLRIFRLSSRQKPCLPARNDALEDPWSDNPSIENRFYNYLIYKTSEAGVLAEEIGNTIFDNFTIAESKLAGIEFYRTNLTKEFVSFRNSAVIGISALNAPTDVSVLTSASGIITPRTDGLKISTIDFYNFQSSMTILEVCSKCSSQKLFSNGAREVFLEQITYTNVTSNYMKINGPKKDIVYDLDGSFTATNFDSTTRSMATVVNNWNHLQQQAQCLAPLNNTKWNNLLACDNTVTVRRVAIRNPIPLNNFRSTTMKVNRINPTNSTSFTQITSQFSGMEPMLDSKINWALPMITGRTYNVWWQSGLDFSHISIDSSRYFTQADNAVILQFNHTEQRQLYELLHMYTPSSKSGLISKSSLQLNPATCKHGDYYTDPEIRRIIQICVSGKTRKQFQLIDVNGIICRYQCPQPITDCPKVGPLKYWSDASIWPNSTIPTAGQNVTIPCDWTIMMDVDPAPANVIEVNGDIYIPATAERGNVKLTANVLWIRAGSLNAGSPTQPFPNNLNIQITGNFNDVGIAIDQQMAGNKMIVVSGKLNLYGIKPSSTWTKLTATAFKDDVSITVADATDWKVGDEIAISASFSSTTEDQKRTITGISGNVISFTNPLLFTHYGAPAVTISNGFGQLDTRASVGLLTRNIKITRGGDLSWGYRLLVYGYNDNTKERMGNVNLHGVELVGGGQYDTDKAAIHIKSIFNPTAVSQIIDSSIHTCGGYCMNIDNAYNLEITGNVFYNAFRTLVAAIGVKKYTFSKNLMMRVSARAGIEELISCYEAWKEIDIANDAVLVQDNVCQGSALHGFAIPHIRCDLLALNPFVNNVAGSCKNGFIYNKVQGDCMGGSKLRAYACEIGQISGTPSTKQIKFDNFMMADCGRAVTLRFGKPGSNTDLTATLTNSFITAISRPSCGYCYGVGAIDCAKNHAIRLLSTTVNGEMMPEKSGMHFDTICRQQNFDAKSFLMGNQFQNFNINYAAPIAQCSQNAIFRPHSLAHDQVGSHHLWNTTCKNCSLAAYGMFDAPSASQLGWNGGCGLLFCTGKNNYLIEDHDGTFIPGGGTLLANNSWIGNGLGCTFYQEMNGYHCARHDLGVLQYQSIAPDFNKRIMWPVYLNYTGGNWTTQTNGWREWDWQGSEPLNHRLGRFFSVIQFGKSYNMSFSAMPPIDMRLQFQRRNPEGTPSDWIIVKLFYPQANSIRVSVGGNAIRPNLIGQNQKPLQQSSTVCGANKYFYFNNTIHFVITGNKDCLVRVNLVSTIQLTAKFQMNIADFFTQNLQTKFVDRMCALLGITDTSRVKVVGVYNGSITLQVVIEAATPAAMTTDSNTASTQSINAISAQLATLTSSGTLQSDLSSNGFGNILSISQKIVPIDSTQSSSSKSNTLLIVIVAVIGSVIILVSLVVISICIIRKRARISEAIIVYPNEMEGNSGQPIPEDSLVDFWKK